MRVVGPEFPYAADGVNFIGRLVVESSPGGRPLAQWLEEHGWTFTLTGPDSAAHEVDLSPWREGSRDEIIQIAFHGIPTELYRERQARGKRPFRS